jgi:hypothetical protein
VRTLSRDWVGRTAVCIATGPSLSLQQCGLVKAWRERSGCKVIAVNNAYHWAPWADVLYFADVRWFDWHNDGVDIPRLGLSARQVREAFRGFAGEKISIESGHNARVSDPGVLVLKNLSEKSVTDGQLSDDYSGIYSGMNSGYQAVDLAQLRGANPIVLVAYDMKVSSNGDSHFFGDHPAPYRTDPASLYQFRQEFKRMAETAKRLGLKILNASADSDLEAFPMVPLASLACA